MFHQKTINDLPTEILEMILLFENPTMIDLRRLAMVCTRWRTILAEYIKRGFMENSSGWCDERTDDTDAQLKNSVNSSEPFFISEISKPSTTRQNIIPRFVDTTLITCTSAQDLTYLGYPIQSVRTMDPIGQRSMDLFLVSCRQMAKFGRCISKPVHPVLDFFTIEGCLSWCLSSNTDMELDIDSIPLSRDANKELECLNKLYQNLKVQPTTLPPKYRETWQITYNEHYNQVCIIIINLRQIGSTRNIEHSFYTLKFPYADLTNFTLNLKHPRNRDKTLVTITPRFWRYGNEYEDRFHLRGFVRDNLLVKLRPPIVFELNFRSKNSLIQDSEWHDKMCWIRYDDGGIVYEYFRWYEDETDNCQATNTEVNEKNHYRKQIDAQLFSNSRRVDFNYFDRLLHNDCQNALPYNKIDINSPSELKSFVENLEPMGMRTQFTVTFNADNESFSYTHSVAHDSVKDIRLTFKFSDYPVKIDSINVKRSTHFVFLNLTDDAEYIPRIVNNRAYDSNRFSSVKMYFDLDL